MITVLALALLTTPLPDALDHLKAVDVVPNVGLLLDASCSMAANPRIPTSCSWFAANYAGNNLNMTKNQVMRAALVGCQSASDGILDRWVNRVNFSIFDFGRSSTDATLRAAFGSSLGTLESAALSVPATGSTPITNAIRAHGRYFGTYFNNANTLQCRPNFVLLLTDGDPNGGPATFDFNCALSGDPRENLYVSANQPWLGSGYMTRHRDELCNVTGEQRIRTYTLGFGAPGSFNPTTLENIAAMGGGQAFYASDITQLDASLNQMINSMIAKSAIFSAAPSIERDGFYTGNFIYAPAFRSQPQGRWAGTVKKHCIEPDRGTSGGYDTQDRRCVFASDDGRTLVTNPAARDLWTGSTTTAADQGGVGLLLLSRLGPGGGRPATPYYPRRIQTWRPGVQGYVDVTSAAWSSADAFTSGLDRNRLINQIHGYTFDANTDGTPVAVASWPYGDSIHAPNVLLRYGSNCQLSGQCFLVVAANDGQIHVHDAANGTERTALVPAELWRPLGVANNLLKVVDDQPTADTTHNYYIDGGMSLFHDDTNGDGLIQPNEVAHLIFGLGRGGGAYYQIPVSQFDGTFSSTNNPVRPLLGLPGTATANLVDTWATPWLGVTTINDQRRRLAVFPTGHIRNFDAPTAVISSNVSTKPRLGANSNLSCTATLPSLGLPVSVCGNYSASSYYPDAVATDAVLGPITIANTAAYRLTFSNVSIDPHDQLLVLDNKGAIISTLSGVISGGTVSPWIYSPFISLRWVTDGHATSHRGYTISNIEVQSLVPSATVRHYPGVYAVDLNRWNGATPNNFAAATQPGATVLEIAEQCTTQPEICVDASVNTDLSDMRCPISTEISVLTTGGEISAMYWGDECGQLWKAWTTDRLHQTWRARRILRLNSTSSSPLGYLSKDYRKVFRRVDLVPSSCPGQRAIGVYFGTGNVQRPTAVDEIANAVLSPGAGDVVGVVWDVPELPSNVGLSDLADVTTVVRADPRATGDDHRYGWFWRLGSNERMLRDPLVFDGIAYFKTFRPSTNAAECTNSTGVDTVYAVDNCSASPVVHGASATFQVGDRVAWSGSTDVGGDLLLMTTRGGQPLVSVANLNRSERAAIVADDQGRVPRIFHWREPRRD